MKPDVEGAPLRRAALTLHALPEEDRAWMLESLSPADRQILGALLAELDGLGIPSDPALLVPPDSARREDETGRWPEVLDDAGIFALNGVLSREPSSVTRALLSIRTWTWRARLLEAMDARMRAEVEAQPVTGATRTHFSDALLEALGTQLDREPRPAPARTSRWKTPWIRIGRRA